MLELKSLYSKIKSKTGALFGETASLSYPMADVENGICIDKFFVYSIGYNKMRARPYAVIKTSAQDGTILSYVNCHLKDFADTEKFPFSERICYEVPAKSIDEQRSVMSELYALYEDVRKAVFEGQSTDDQRKAINKYLERLEQAVPEGIIPFYRALGENLYIQRTND